MGGTILTEDSKAARIAVLHNCMGRLWSEETRDDVGNLHAVCLHYPGQQIKCTRCPRCESKHLSF